jgi:hypothetical protein
MFGSRSTDVASQLPLWAVQFDKTPGVNTVNTFMGGWKSAVAKQYYLGEMLEHTRNTHKLTSDRYYCMWLQRGPRFVSLNRSVRG